MSQPIPPLIEHWIRVECPGCGLRWWRSRWDAFFYPMHYASAHLGIPVFRGRPERIEIVPLEPKIMRRRAR